MKRCKTCCESKALSEFRAHNTSSDGVGTNCRKCLSAKHDPKERFFSYVKMSNPCWLWVGAKSSRGYGYIFYGGKQQRAHRVSYQIHAGSIPDGFVVMHRCDTPLCVKPDHLVVGTYADNSHDRDRKGRTCKGKRHHWYKHGRKLRCLTQQSVQRPS